MHKGWSGGGRFQMARLGPALMIHFNHLTSRGGKFQADMGDFFRKNARDIRPDFAPYDVRIWIEHTGKERRIDVDNVAKACLDCLTGVLWQDDAQVKRLLVEKRQGMMDQVHMLAKPCTDLPDACALEDYLKDIDE